MSRWTVVLIAVVLLLPGCVYVTEPLSDPDKAQVDKQLLGKWELFGKSELNGSSFEISCPVVKGNPKGLMHVKDWGSWFFTTTIGKNTYWTVCCDADFGKEGAFERWNKRDDRLFHVLLVKLDGDNLILTYGSSNVKEVMSAEMITTVKPAMQNYDRTYYKTPPGWLAKYLEKNGPENLYGGGTTLGFRRAKASGKE